jgi:hypothetical protein
MVSRTQGRRPSGRAKPIEGNDLLYHFFQKILFEEDVEQFHELAKRLVVSLGVWLPREAYRRYPLLVPYAIRDPKCRGDKRRGLPDEWGTPDSTGLFRDDNSLIKGIPRSLPVVGNSLMNGRKLGTSFVAAHVWRKLGDGGDAPRNALTYSFLPNLVWLPSQLAKLSDREGSFVQTLLQAISLKIYRSVKLSPPLSEFAEAAWAPLPEREGAALSLPDMAELNFFAFDENWLDRRIKTLRIVTEALAGVASGKVPSRKIVSSRYGSGLATLDASAQKLRQRLVLLEEEALPERVGHPGGEREGSRRSFRRRTLQPFAGPCAGAAVIKRVGA